MPKHRFSVCVILSLAVLAIGLSAPAATPPAKHVPRVAALVTAYYHNSHADVIVSRLLQTMTFDGKGERPNLKLVSLYIDQPESSHVGLEIARQYGVPLFKKPADALTLGGKSLAVDGVLLIGEHGRYPLSGTGQVMFPKRRLFSEILEVFDHSGRVVPVYTDKHLADNWEDAKWLYESARHRGFPLLAGSSVPLTWRYPPLDVPRGAKISEIAVTTYGSLEAYGYHGLEVLGVSRRAQVGRRDGRALGANLDGRPHLAGGQARAFSTASCSRRPWHAAGTFCTAPPAETAANSISRETSSTRSSCSSNIATVCGRRCFTRTTCRNGRPRGAKPEPARRSRPRSGRRRPDPLCISRTW